MKAKLKIGIVGCGAIGSSLAKIIQRDLAQKARLVALYDKVSLKSEALAKRIAKNKLLAVKDLKSLIAKSDLVIEAASAQSSRDIACWVLAAGRDIMIMSVGGIVGYSQELSRLAEAHQAKVYIPSGAICGIDGLKAANQGKIKQVILTTRKHPLSFKGVKYVEAKKIALGKIRKDTVLYSGSARQAMKFFPQNINVAGILSLAGIGDLKTKIRIIASPKAKKNIHEIRIASQAGNILTRTENVLHPDNPKTSFLAVLSAAATLKQILQPVRIGA